MNWPTIPLGKLADFRNGINYSRKNFGKGIKVIGVSDFQDYSKPHYENLEEVNPKGVVSDEDILENEDIVFVRSNGNKDLIGRSLFIDSLTERVTFSGFCIRARFFDKSECPRFYSFVFKTDIVRRTLSARGGGTNIANLNQKILKTLEVPYPSCSIRASIASILSNYDDLIDNNNRRIALLEESVHRLYREWFVHLRFPGHERVTVRDGVPEGWEKKELQKLAVLHYGKSLTKKKRKPGLFPVYGSSGIVGTHKSYLVKGPGIVIGRKGNVGSAYWSFKDFYPIDTVYYIDSNQASYFLYISLSKMSFVNTDAAVPGLNRSYAYSRLLLVPNPSTLEKFESIASDSYQQIHQLELINTQLREARDRLLPRLMNGTLTP